jgi:hypothetical protein
MYTYTSGIVCLQKEYIKNGLARLKAFLPGIYKLKESLISHNQACDQEEHSNKEHTDQEEHKNKEQTDKEKTNGNTETSGSVHKKTDVDSNVGC